MVVTNSEELYKKASYFKNLCFPLEGKRNYTHDEIGFNYRMSNVIAAIGLAQVEKADEYKQLRIVNNQLYRNYLKSVPGIIFQPIIADYLNVCWMNAIVINPQKYGHSKDELIAHLKFNGIDTRLLFNGMHNQKSLNNFGCDCSGDYPVSDWLTLNGLYLPSASNLKKEQIKEICEIISEFSVS
jgi:perosamine synthetase